jgi:hypothetical protein
LERMAALQHAVPLLWIQVAHAVHEGTRRANTNLLPRPQRRSRPALIRPVIIKFIRPAIKIV